MSEATPHTRRRWFQFGLGTMLLVVALLAVSAFAAREHRERKRLEAASSTEREQFAAQIQTLQNGAIVSQRQESTMAQRRSALLEWQLDNANRKLNELRKAKN